MQHGIDVEVIRRLLWESGVQIDSRDPVFKILLANKLVLEMYTAEVSSSAVSAAELMERASIRAIKGVEDRAKSSVQHAASNIVTNAARDLVVAIRQEMAPVASAAKRATLIATISLVVNVVLALVIVL